MILRAPTFPLEGSAFYLLAAGIGKLDFHHNIVACLYLGTVVLGSHLAIKHFRDFCKLKLGGLLS